MKTIYNPTGKKLNATRDMRGSNQYQRIVRVRRPRLRAFTATTTLGVIAAYVLTTLWLIPFYNDVKFKPAYAPTVDKAYALVIPTATPTPDEHQEIRDYIIQVFRKDSDKAFKLLNCENHALNPKAMNDNTKWGGVGRDWGVFQINDKWQGVSNVAFLTDYKINIDIAHNIYVRNGDFHLWTCGRNLKI